MRGPVERRDEVTTVLFATELAGGEDALAPLAAIADGLADLKVACVFALPDLAAGRRLLGRRFAVVPAARWPAQRPGWRAAEIADYTDVLARIGFAEADALAGVAEAWQRLVALTGPDLVIAQAAPGLLAGLADGGPPVMLVGSPYAMPPVARDRFAPLAAGRVPVLPQNRLIEPLLVLAAERGTTPPDSVAALFAAPERFVYGLPELDPYGAHRREPLLAPPGVAADLAEPPRRPRLFLSLDGGFVGLAAVVQALAELDVEVLAYLRGEAAQPRAFLAARGAAVFQERPDLGRVVPGVSHVLSHGDGLTAEAALAGGRPHLVVPLSHEAMAHGRLLELAGAGSVVSSIRDSVALRQTLEAFLGDKAMAEAALRAAQAAAGRDRRGLVEAVREAVASRVRAAAVPAPRGAARARPGRSRRRSTR